MLTLVSNITSNYKKLGKKPRVFVRIPSASIFLGTKQADTFYDDFILNFDTISQSIDKYGGMAEVSGFGIQNLELGQQVTLCTEGNDIPKREGQYDGTGRIYAEGALYLTVRNSATGTNFASPAIVTGRNYISATTMYQVYRGYLQFSLASGITSCEEAVLELTGMSSNTNQTFSLYLVQGNWTALSQTTGIFNDFEDWDLTGEYGVTNLIETFSSTEFTTGTNKLRLNAAGKALIVSGTGTTIKFALLSSRDVLNSTAPTSQEYIQFETASARLKIRYNTKTLDNQYAEVYLAYETVPVNISGNSDYTQMQLLWKGVVDDYSINDKYLNLKLKQNDHKKNIMIPKKVVTKDVFADCPDESIGKPYPVVYGDFTIATAELEHRNGIGYFKGDASSEFGAFQYGYTNNLLKALLVKNTYPYQVLLSELSMKNSAKPFYFWNSSGEFFEVFPCASASETPVDTEVLKQLSDPDFNYFPDNLVINTESDRYFTIQTIKPYSVTAVNSASDGKNAYADNPALYGYLPGENDAFRFYFIDPKGLSINTLEDKWLLSCYITLEAGGEIQISFEQSFDSGNTWTDHLPTDYYDITASGWFLTEILTPKPAPRYFHTSAGVPITDVSMLRVIIHNTQAPDKWAKIYNVCIIASHTLSDTTKITTSGQGHEDDGSGTVTGTPAKLIEIPSQCIESIARAEMSLATAEIDTAAFDTSGTELGSWEFAFQLNEREGARAILHNLYRQCRSKGLWDEQDRLSIKTFDAGAYFPVSGTDTPSGLDVFDSTGTPASDAVTTNPIFDISIDRVGLDDVKNDFVLKYKKNYASNDYLGTLYMTNGLGTAGNVETNMTLGYLENGQTLTVLKGYCADSYTKYQTTNTLEFEADCIRDEATANKLLQYLIERMWKRRYIVTVTTKMNAVGHELGDFINIRDTRINDLFGETTASLKKWEIIRREVDLNNMKITFTTIEVD